MSDAAPRRSRASFWLILAVSAAPVVASYLAFYFWPPAHTVNYGELIEPRPLPDAPLATPAGAMLRLADLKGRWVLVTVDGGRCDARCERKLLYMRQLRLTQGKNSGRVERLWLVNDEAAPVAPQGVVEGVHVARAVPSLLEAFPAAGTVEAHIYVVDPLGNLMMRFPPDPDPKGMVRDLTRLLKTSRVG